MKNKLKALLPLLFVIALIAVIPLAVNADECSHANLTHVEAVEERCHFEGNLEYWYCADCDQYWLDEELTFSVNRRLVTLPSLDGDMMHIEEIAPTCTTPGNIEYWLCEECGLKRPCIDDAYIPEIEYDIPALGHDYVDGVCTRCGDVDAPVVLVDGLHMTVSGLKGVKDYFIAKGNYNTYRELKPYYVMRVTPAKINGANEYIYTLKEAGEYTICVRFEDPSKENLILYVTVDVPTPEISVNGLSATLSGLEGIRVIRTAPGEWNTPGEVKRAAGARNISARSIGSDPYVIKYSAPGVYTVTLEYYNGLVVVETVEITRREPTMVRDGNTITFGNLDGLYVIRYAPGEFTYAGDIKRAEGAKFIRPSAIDENGEISFDIGDGVYTVCVQYNDGSYNYFTVNKEEGLQDAGLSLLEKYGLSYDTSFWINLMPGAGEPKHFIIGFRSENGSDLPDISVYAKFTANLWTEECELVAMDEAGKYRVSTDQNVLEYLPINKGDEVHIELTITINGESETIEMDRVLVAVY